MNNNPKIPKPKTYRNPEVNGLPSFDILNKSADKVSEISDSSITILSISGLSRAIKKILKWGLPLSLIIWLLFRYFLYWDFSSNCKIWVMPSWMQLNNHTVIEAINYLKDNYPQNYQDLCSRITKIDPNPVLDCGGIGGGCFLGLTNRTIYIGTFPKQVVITAAAIAREACHQKQYDEKRQVSEKECSKISDTIQGKPAK